MRTRPIGSVVGAIGGLAFVLVNAGPLPASLFWRIAGVIGFVAIAWFVVLKGPEADRVPPSRTALRSYLMSVVAMVVAIPVGATFITNVLEKPDTVPVWVVFVVGLHFHPFARAFQLPVFRWLSMALVVVSVIGAFCTLPDDSATTAAWTGVVAGFVLLGFAAVGPRLSRAT